MNALYDRIAAYVEAHEPVSAEALLEAFRGDATRLEIKAIAQTLVKDGGFAFNTEGHIVARRTQEPTP